MKTKLFLCGGVALALAYVTARGWLGPPVAAVQGAAVGTHAGQAPSPEPESESEPPAAVSPEAAALKAALFELKSMLKDMVEHDPAAPAPRGPIHLGGTR